MPVTRAAEMDDNTEPKLIIQGRVGSTDDLLLVKTATGTTAMRVAYDGTITYGEVPPPASLTYSERIAALNPFFFSPDALTSGVLINNPVNNPLSYTYICRFIAGPTATGGFFGFDDKAGFINPGPSDRSLYLDAGKITLYNYNGASYYLTTASSYRDAFTHTLTARMGGGLPTAIFVDGVKVANSATTGAYNYAGYFKAGYSFEGGQPVDPSVIKPAIFLTALTDAQILEIHGAT